jgi:SAM-dependent methyltransferase
VKKLGLPLEYNKLSEFFDAWNVNDGTEDKNAVIENILKGQRIKSVLDMTCGTGSQVFFLKKLGYDVVGTDLSKKLIKLAKNKTKGDKIEFYTGDIRTIKLNRTFDAVITIFNAIGHLTKIEFAKAIQNIHNHLNPGGIYVFDIFNLDAITDAVIKDFACYVHKDVGEYQFLSTQCSTIDREKGLLTSYDVYMIQKNAEKPKILRNNFSLQIYNADDIQEILNKNGFDVVAHYDMNGNPFIEDKSLSILTVAKKR